MQLSGKPCKGTGELVSPANGIEQTLVPALTFNPPIKINSSLKLRHALPALRCATTARRQTAVAASRGQGATRIRVLLGRTCGSVFAWDCKPATAKD